MKVALKQKINILLLIVGLFYTGLNFYHHNWTKDYRVIEWDVISYYAYLPATFIHGDLSLDFVDEPGFVNDNKFWYNISPINKKVIKTSMGMSYMYAPFFFLGHFTALIIGEETNGFTGPYKFWLVFGTLIYFLCGLYFLYRFLKNYYFQKIVHWTLLTICLGSNLLYYTCFEATMSHSYSFSLICIFLYLFHKWYQKPTNKRTILMGTTLGLISLIRPTNILILFVFILWEVDCFSKLNSRIRFFIQNIRKIAIMVFFFVIIWIPQFLYWKYISGSFLYSPYSSSEEGFFFFSPKILDVLLSFKKGLFIYTPILLVSTLGFFSLWKKHKGISIALLVCLICFTYVISSWWSWWYGGSFGSRPFVDIYALFTIPLAALFQYLFKQRQIFKTIFLSFIILIITLNLFQTEQYLNQAIHFVGMNKEVYKENFLKLKPTGRSWGLLTLPDANLARKGIYIHRRQSPRTNENENIADYFDEIKNDSTQYFNWERKAKKQNILIDSLIFLEAKRQYSLKQKQNATK